MMASSYYVILVTCLLTSTFVEGCVKYTAPKVDDAGNTEYNYLRTTMKTCMTEGSWSEAIVDYFVLHTSWFETTHTTTCKDDATANCWMTSFKDLFYYEPNFMAKAVECATRYETAAMGTKLRKKRSLKVPTDDVRSRRAVTVTPNPVLCPPYPDGEFASDITASISSLPNQDTTVQKFAELLALSHLITIKPEHATCDVVFTNAQFTNDEKVTGCDTCNYLMISSLLKSSSSITSTIAKAAVKKSQSTSGICAPDLKLRLDDVMLATMGVTSPADQVMLGAHKYCTNDVISTNLVVNDECKPTIVTSSAGSQQILFQVALDKCDIKKTLVGDEYIYEAFVTYIPQLETDAVIGRFKCSTFKFQCAIPTQLKTTFGNPLHPQVKTTIDDELTDVSSYKLSFVVTHEGQPLTDNHIQVGKKLDAKLKLLNVINPSNYKLRAGDCWASKTVDSNVKTDIYKIIDCVGCKEKNSFETVGDEIEVTQNDATEVAFTFRSFEWTNTTDDKIYLHCKINLCHSKVQTCPTSPDCQQTAVCPVVSSGRMRRSTGDVTKTMSFGPIHVTKRDVSEDHDVNPCSVNNGGCNEICEQGKLNEVICSCFDDGKLMMDGKSCFNVQQESRVETKTTYMMSTPLSDLVIVCVFIITIFISAVIFKSATNL